MTATCPGCGKSFAPPPGSAGTEIRCGCGTAFVIGRAPAGPAAPAEPPGGRAWSPGWVVTRGVAAGWAAAAVAFVAHVVVWPHAPPGFADYPGEIGRRAAQARLLSYLACALAAAALAAYWWASGVAHPGRKRLAVPAALGAAAAAFAALKVHPATFPF